MGAIEYAMYYYQGETDYPSHAFAGDVMRNMWGKMNNFVVGCDGTETQ